MQTNTQYCTCCGGYVSLRVVQYCTDRGYEIKCIDCQNKKKVCCEKAQEKTQTKTSA